MNDRPLRAAVTALGCKVNFAEMAELAGALAAAGIDVVAEDEPADVRVLNSCAVTLQADATSRQRLRRLRRLDPGCHLVLTGCTVDANFDYYMKADGTPAVPGVDAVFANADKSRIADHLVELARRAGATGDPRPRPGMRSRFFLKVQEGCDHRCTYCTVWRARGRSVSVPLDESLRRAESALADGYHELVLTGVDLGAWGRDLMPRSCLAALVGALLDIVGEGRLRLSSVNANDITRELAALTAHPRLCSHWHVPLQSGSDTVLRAMHRGYRTAQYANVARWLRAADAGTELTTDVMVGFPGESDADHRATLELVEELEMLDCHVFRWSPRPDTPAVTLPGRVDDTVAQRRSREVRRVAARSGEARRRRVVGSTLEVIWERVEDGVARGVSDRYHTVVAAAGPATLPGAVDSVIISAVEGEVLRGSLPASAALQHTPLPPGGQYPQTA